MKFFILHITCIQQSCFISCGEATNSATKSIWGKNDFFLYESDDVYSNSIGRMDLDVQLPIGKGYVLTAGHCIKSTEHKPNL